VRVAPRVGPAADLSAYRGRELTPALAREVTDLLMGEVRDMLGKLRGEVPPDQVYGSPEPGTGPARRSA